MVNTPFKESYDKSFSIYFESIYHAYCSISTFTAPMKIASGLSITLYDEEPAEITIDAISDSGTEKLSNTVGYETKTCGPFKALIKQGL